MKQQLLYTLLFLFGMSFSLSAQISLGGTPMSLQLGLTDDDIEVISMPDIDLKALRADDILRANDNLPYRFAQGFPVSANIYTIGTWTTLPNGDRLWRLKIECQEALSINFLYDDFYIPSGGLYYIYAEDLSEVIGAFGAHNNRPSRKFATGLVNSTSVILEYFEPAAVAGQGMISVSQVAHGYRDFENRNDPNAQAEGLGDAGNCQVNINCPEGNNWQIEKKAVARILINGVETCTGTLINNIANNCTPYFLTAEHCIDGTYDAVTNPDISGAVFYWNYERAGCANSGSVPNETTAGATVVANADPPSGDASASDFALFELTEDPSDDYDVYIAGFDASGSPGTNGVGIHHPGLDAKKIATHSITPTSVVNNNYWRIYWDQTANGHSVTEGGSSGSGLFNSDKRLIGQLFGGFLGGQPNCSDPADDEGDYGKLSISWDGTNATDPRRRLRDWLDPNNTGLKVVDGRDCRIPDYALSVDPTNSTNCGTDNATFAVDVQSINGYLDPVTLGVSGLPGGTNAIFSTNPVTPGNVVTLTINGLNGLADGDYNFNLTGISTSGNRIISLSFTVQDQSTATLTSPTNGAANRSRTPSLEWVAVSGADSYDVQVATDISFSNVVASANVSTSSWLVDTELAASTDYYWRVRHVRVCGNDPWSATFQFTTLVACDANSPFFEDFEGGQPTGWTFNVTNTNEVWEFNSASVGSGLNNSGSGNWATYDDDETGNTGNNNVATATTPIIDLSAYTDVVLTFKYSYKDYGPASEEVLLSVTDGSLTYYWSGSAWTSTATNWLGGTSSSGEFNNPIPTDLNTGSLSVTFEYDDNSGWAWAFGFDDFGLCGNEIGSCENTLAINDLITDGVYSAANTLTSSATILSGSTVTFEAGQAIILKAGFVAEAGADFLAHIQACDAIVQPEVEERGAAVATESIKVFPNPFRQQSTIDIQLAEANDIQIQLFDLTGQRIRTVANERNAQIGTHRYQLNAQGLNTGMYMLVIRMGDRIETRKLSLIR
ncbi:MAG: 3-coathanger stack domain-containing protein [Bacteroidota bacterium]